MRTMWTIALASAWALLAPENLPAHGGRYLGPEDVVPPNPGGGGGRRPGPGGPVTPRPGGPGGPALPGPLTPGGGPGTGGGSGPGGGGGPATGSGIQLAPDLTGWEFWWEFNRDPYIALRDAIHTDHVTTGGDEFFMGYGRRASSRNTLAPTRSQILGEILPALNRALESTGQRDIVSSCMVAMAKIGEDTEDIHIVSTLRRRLTERDQEVRETAALALGISQLPEALPDLLALLRDDAAGRRLVADSSVDDRTRAFAAFGVGLIAWATSDHDVKQQALDALLGALADDRAANGNVRVPVICAIGLLRPDPASPKGRTMLIRALTALDAYFARDLGASEELIQSHTLTAAARLLDASCDEPDAELASLVAHHRDLCLAIVTDRAPRKLRGDDPLRAAILALGQLTPRADGDVAEPATKAVSDALVAYERSGRDAQARYFAMIALAQIGGTANRDALLAVLERGQKALEKPWAAIALGVLAYREREATGRDPRPDDLVGQRLEHWLGALKTPSAVGALAVGLGLAGHRPAADAMLESLDKYASQDQLAGYLCIGLALLGDDRAREPIRRLVETSVRRPERLLQAAVALGKLGDKSAVDTLQHLLAAGDQNLARLSAIASALAFVGDRRSVQPLCRMLFDPDLTDLSRAFAAVALGGVADKESLPWNSKIRCDMNYRAAVETLTNQVNGVLDIL
ncbi:MAG: HEAT repeat domain-containing protein [Planctomycetes bacterium]|nr:HEAT repeat domain-containing protein [Planctomycetota bacterium]